MKELFDNDFVQHFGILSKDAIAEEYPAGAGIFDVDDQSIPPITIVGKGQLTINATENLNILAYEKFINKCKTPRSFGNGRKRCDYLLTTHTSKSAVCLVEMTSATGDANSLFKPINDSASATYPGGKNQRCEIQLAKSLETMMEVQSIRDDFKSRNRKICLMSYIVKPYANDTERMRHPFQRFLFIESKEVKNDGAIIHSPFIEAFGFEYRRTSHDYAFTI